MQAEAGPQGEGSEVWARQDHEAADGGSIAERSDSEGEMLAFNKEVVDEKINARLCLFCIRIRTSQRPELLLIFISSTPSLTIWAPSSTAKHSDYKQQRLRKKGINVEMF